MAARLRFSALGPLCVETADSVRTPVRGRVGGVLAALLARTNERVSTDLLIDAVWGSTDSPTPKSTLQVTINRLRSLIDERSSGGWSLVVSDGDGYRMAVDDSSYDALEFEGLVAAARRARKDDSDEKAAELYNAALALWRGSAFGDFADLPLVRSEAIRLEEAKLAAEDEHVDVRLDIGEHRELIPTLTGRIDATPLRERRWAHLMLALYRANRQGDALRIYQRLRSTIGAELGIEPSHDLRQLEEAILLQDPRLDLPRERTSISLPVFADHFIGREVEIARLASVIEKTRLTTLVGIGGMGKTRLAIEVAGRTDGSYTDGVVYLNLSELVDNRQLAGHFIDHLQPSRRHEPSHGEVEAIVDLLRNRDTLLVIDNAEEFAEPLGPLLGKIVSSCPQVRVLVVSRLPLRLPGETVWNLPPMSYEEKSGDAASLLIHRSGLSPGEVQLADLLEICKLTGGIPLGLELAASALSTRPPSEVVDLLRKDLGTLDRAMGSSSGPALYTVTRWSLDHLEDNGLETLKGLCLFRGGFDIDAARTVVSDALELDRDEVSHQLHQLVESGLVRFMGDRYSILEPVRQIAEQDLNENALNSVTEAHIAYFSRLAMAARQAFEFVGSDQEEWYLRLERERANFGAMLERGFEKLDPKVLDALPGLAIYWSRRGEVNEGSEWIGRALDRFAPIDDDYIETILLGAHLAMWAGDVGTSDARLTELERRLADSGPGPLTIRTKHSRGNLVGWGYGRPAESIPFFLEAVAESQAIHYPAGLVSLLSAAYMAVRTGDNQRALELIEYVPELAEVMATVTGRDGSAFADLGTDQIAGLVDLYEGRLDSAEELLYRSVDAASAVGIGAITGPLLIPAGWASLLAGSIDRAAETATNAHRFVQDDGAGWRAAEAFCLLGGVALEQDNLDSASRWFARAIADATHAPELDLVVWALAGLAGLDLVNDRPDEAGHLLGHLAALAEDISLVLPRPLTRWLGLDTAEITQCDRIGSKRELEHLVTAVKFDTRLEWGEIL